MGERKVFQEFLARQRQVNEKSGKNTELSKSEKKSSCSPSKAGKGT